MAKQVFKVFVHRDLSGVMPDFLSASNHAGTRCFEEYVAVGPIDIEVDVPDFGASVEIAALERQLAEQEARSAESIAAIRDRISKLQAIGNEVAE